MYLFIKIAKLNRFSREVVMGETLLSDKAVFPDDSVLKKTLGNCFSFFQSLNDLTKNFNREWKFYNSKSGWVYKVGGKKKALFYITPDSQSFRIGFAVREAEKELLLDGELSPDIREKLLSAEKFPEGYALRLSIRNENDYDNLQIVLKTIMEARGEN